MTSDQEVDAEGNGGNVPVLTELHVGLFLPTVPPNLISVD